MPKLKTDFCNDEIIKKGKKYSILKFLAFFR